MSETVKDFNEAYKSHLLEMLVKGEELSLSYTPLVSLSGYLQEGQLQGFVNKESINDLDFYSPDNLKKVRLVDSGELGLTALKATVSINLMLEVCEEELGSSDANGLSKEQELTVDDIKTKIDKLIENPKVNYTNYKFTDTRTGEEIDIKSHKLSDNLGNPLGRNLTISIKDQYLNKELTIKELPKNFDGDMQLEVKQYLKPIVDEQIKEAVEFFLSVGFNEGISYLMYNYANELGPGNAQKEEDELLTRFSAYSSDSDKLKDLIAKFKARATAINEYHKLLLSNPEVELPSAEELFDYKKIIDDLLP